MKKITSILAFIVLLTISSFGQSENEYSSTLKTLFEVSGSEESFEVALTQMFNMYKKQYTEVNEEIWVEFEKEFRKTSLNDLVVMLVPVYEKYMTLEDLKELIKFYESPVGKKYAKSTPLIMQESMQVGQQWGMKIGQSFIEKMNKVEQ